MLYICMMYISWEMTPTFIDGEKQECRGILELAAKMSEYA